MILTINYTDLQNIKQQMLNDKITDNKKIYSFIDSYNETLNYMYKNKLIKNKSKKDLEDELVDFASQLLKNTDKSYSQMEKEYMKNTDKSIYSDKSKIQFKL